MTCRTVIILKIYIYFQYIDPMRIKSCIAYKKSIIKCVQYLPLYHWLLNFKYAFPRVYFSKLSEKSHTSES